MKLNKESARLSIIIPVLNEEAYLPNLLNYLKEHCTEHSLEIIVVDGGSTDRTVELAETFGIKTLLSTPGRAAQMNCGARAASGDILYFLHVDTFPPPTFEKAILAAVSEGNKAGCFRMKFDTNSKFLNFFAWFTKINHILCRGGDQSLYVTKSLFRDSGGFNEDYKIYEDTEYIRRLYKLSRFKVIPETVITSARKYHKIGAVRLQYHFSVIHVKRILGAGPEKLHDYYRRHISVT